MALATGVFNASQNPAELNARSFAGTILRLFPNGSAPLFAMTSQSGKSKAKSATHGYFSKTLTFVRQVLATGVLIGDTSITVPSSTGILANTVLFNTRTRENVRVTSVTSATAITVVRGFGRVPAEAMNSTDVLIAVGTAAQENSTRPNAKRLTTVYVPNYTQIFRNAWALTDTARASYSEAGYSNIAEDRKECGMFHSIDIESAIIWGQPMMDTSGEFPIHTTQGVLDAIEQYSPGNSNTAGSTTTLAQLVALVEPMFQYSTDMSNPKERMFFGDNQAVRVLNEIGTKAGVVQMNNATTSFGMKFTRFDFYNGSLNIATHPLLNGLGMAGTGLIMDMPALKLAYMDGRDSKVEGYGQGGAIVESGVDGVGGSLTSELAVELINPYSCGVIYGLTAGAA